MKYFYFFVLQLYFYSSVHGQLNYITFSPNDCLSCIPAIENMKNKEFIYVFKEEFKIDSTSLVNKFPFLRNSSHVFNDSIYNKRSIDGRMTISNSDNSLKYSLVKINKNSAASFEFFTDINKSDTIEYSYPISKSSIIKRKFTNNGNLLILDALENKVVLFDLIKNEILDEVELTEEISKQAYGLFTLSDVSIYDHFKLAISPKIYEPLSNIKDMSIDGDELIVSTSNYFYYTSSEKKTDTFLNVFLSIHKFYFDNESQKFTYKDTFVPTNIKEQLTSLSLEFYPVSSNVHFFNNLIFTSITNKIQDEENRFLYGVFDITNMSLDWVVKLNDKFENNYNFTNAIFYKNFCLIGKSSKMYNLSNKEIVDLDYFNEFDNLQSNKVSYLNQDFKVNKNEVNILYRNYFEHNSIYFVNVDLDSKKVINHVKQDHFKSDLATYFNPYSNDGIIQFIDNYKVVVHRIKKD